MIMCPAFAVFGVIDIEVLSVPACVTGGEAGVKTAGLKSIWRSYEITPRPVTSPTVIGIAIGPGVALITGSDTVTLLPTTVGPAERVVIVIVFAGIAESAAANTGATLVCSPKNCAVESKNPRREPAPYAETLSSIAKIIARSPKFFAWEDAFEKELFSELNLDTKGVMTLLTVNDDIDISLRNAFDL